MFHAARLEELAVAPPDQKKSSQAPASAWALAFEGTQITAITLVAFFAGRKLDQLWQSEPWCMLIGAILGFTLGLVSFIRRALKW